MLSRLGTRELLVLVLFPHRGNEFRGFSNFEREREETEKKRHRESAREIERERKRERDRV